MDFKDNQTDIISEMPDDAAQLKARMKNIIERIIATPDGIDLVNFLVDHQVPLRFSREAPNAAYTDNTIPRNGVWVRMEHSACILLNPDWDDTALVSSILHEARHAQQAAKNTMRPNDNISAFDFAWFTRFIEADAQSESVLKAFKMKLAGDDSLFKAAQQFGYEKMFIAAEEGYAQDPSSLNDGRLRRMIFDAWFTPEVAASYDVQVASYMYPNRLKLLALVPDHGLSKGAITLQDIEKIGVCGGEKINYMTLPGFRSLSDMYYLGNIAPENLVQLQILNEVWKQSPEKQPPAPQKAKGPGM